MTYDDDSDLAARIYNGNTYGKMSPVQRAPPSSFEHEDVSHPLTSLIALTKTYFLIVLFVAVYKRNSDLT